MTDPLLNSVMCRLMEPAVLIDAQRQLVFATDSFNRLIGCERFDSPCDCLLIPSVDDQGRVLCCWDVLDDYLARQSRGLWLLGRSNGTFLPALCTPSPVDIAGVHSYVHVRIEPLEPPANATELLFRSVSERSGGIRHFREWIKGYLRNARGVHGEWLMLESDGPDGILPEVLERTGWCGPFDMRLRRSGRTLIQRVFPPERTEQAAVLVVREGRKKLDAGLVRDVWAAVRAANRRESASPVDIPDALLLSTLSPREREVVGCITEGLGDAQIAERLHLSIHTVKNHIRHAMDKCGVHKRLTSSPA